MQCINANDFGEMANGCTDVQRSNGVPSVQSQTTRLTAADA
jgi:hypothetical protein